MTGVERAAFAAALAACDLAAVDFCPAGKICTYSADALRSCCCEVCML